MESKNHDDYYVNILRPSTPYTKAISKMIISIVLIWLIAVLGFQVLLKVIEKPTPEQNYISFQKVWGNVEKGQASKDELKTFLKTTVQLSGKTLNAQDRLVVSQAFGWGLKQVVSKESFTGMLGRSYMENSKILANELGWPPNGVIASIAPYLFPKNGTLNLDREKLPSIMKKYSVHNQSFLTDFRFLGFPFHYWYTAAFLLMFFVFLCWFYCMRVVALQKKFNISDEVQAEQMG